MQCENFIREIFYCVPFDGSLKASTNAYMWHLVQGVAPMVRIFRT